MFERELAEIIKEIKSFFSFTQFIQSPTHLILTTLWFQRRVIFFFVFQALNLMFEMRFYFYLLLLLLCSLLSLSNFNKNEKKYLNNTYISLSGCLSEIHKSEKSKFKNAANIFFLINLTEKKILPFVSQAVSRLIYVLQLSCPWCQQWEII